MVYSNYIQFHSQQRHVHESRNANIASPATTQRGRFQIKHMNG